MILFFPHHLANTCLGSKAWPRLSHTLGSLPDGPGQGLCPRDCIGELSSRRDGMKGPDPTYRSCLGVYHSGKQLLLFLPSRQSKIYLDSSGIKETEPVTWGKAVQKHESQEANSLHVWVGYSYWAWVGSIFSSNLIQKCKVSQGLTFKSRPGFGFCALCQRPSNPLCSALGSWGLPVSHWCQPLGAPEKDRGVEGRMVSVFVLPAPSPLSHPQATAWWGVFFHHCSM